MLRSDIYFGKAQLIRDIDKLSISHFFQLSIYLKENFSELLKEYIKL